jgi:hypothetical protein
MKLDRYALDFSLWGDWAVINYSAAQRLFQTGDPFLWFPAATLGHHALEMYLKSALIANGMTVFDPNKVKLLETGVDLAAGDCAWGHGLVQLAAQLAQRHPMFDPSKQMDFNGVVIEGPLTIREGLNIFDPFFSELRYPREMNMMEGFRRGT